MSEQKKFEIECSKELLEKIEEHCFSSTKTEVGGFLVGVVSDGKSKVTHVLKAKHTANTQSQLTFTNKTWETAFAEMSEISGDAQLIGWFHSHPNFGVFLSDYDKFIQNEFFNKDGMITIVVDPINGKRGWFISIDKEVRPYAEEENTELEKLGLDKAASNGENSKEFGVEMKSRSSGSGVSIGRTIAIAGVFSLFSLLANFAISGGQSADIDKIGLQNQIDRLQDQITQLELLTNTAEVNPNVQPEESPASTQKNPSDKKSPPAGKTSPKATTATKSLKGTPCPDIKVANKIEGGKSYECVKSGEKLIWQQIPSKKSPSVKPTSAQSPSSKSPSSKPTSTQSATNTSQPNSSQPSSSPSAEPTPEPTKS